MVLAQQRSAAVSTFFFCLLPSPRRNKRTKRGALMLLDLVSVDAVYLKVEELLSVSSVHCRLQRATYAACKQMCANCVSNRRRSL
jgi:hypothetical protein